MPVTEAGPTTDEQLIGSWFSVELDNGIEGQFTDVNQAGFHDLAVLSDHQGISVVKRRLEVIRVVARDRSFLRFADGHGHGIKVWG